MTLVAHVDPDTHRAWSESLAELIRTDAAEQTAQARLSEIADAVREHPRKVDWRRLDRRVGKVQCALRKAADPPWELHDAPESRDEKAKREARLATLQEEPAQTERWLDSRPGPAEACMQAALDEIGPCVVESLPVHSTRSAQARRTPRGKSTEMRGCPSLRVGFHGGPTLPRGQVRVRRSRPMAKFSLAKPECSAARGSARTGPTGATPCSTAARRMVAGVT